MFDDNVMTTEELRIQAYNNIRRIVLRVALPIAVVLGVMMLLQLNPIKMERGAFVQAVLAIYIVGLLSIVCCIIAVIFNMKQIASPYIERDEWFIQSLTDLRCKMLYTPQEQNFKRYLNRARNKRNGLYFTDGEFHKLTCDVRKAINQCSLDQLNEYAKSSLIDS